MLSFIPLALFGGLQTPSPWDGNYNKEAPKPTIPAEETGGLPGIWQRKHISKQIATLDIYFVYCSHSIQFVYKEGI